MRKYLNLLLIVAFAASMLVMGIGCKEEAMETAAEVAAEDQYVFSCIMWSTADPNIDWIVKPGEDYMKLNPKVKIEFTGPTDYNAPEHLEFLEAAIAKGVDGIYLHVSDTVALRPAFEKAKEEGIPIIVHTGRFNYEQLPKDLFLAQVGWDEVQMGANPAKYLVENYGTPVHVAAQLAHVGHAGQEIRVSSFEKELPPGTKLTRMPIGDDPTKAKELITSFFQANPDVDVVFNTTSLGVAWVVNVAEELGIADDIIQIGTSDSPADIEGILLDKVDFTNGVQFYVNGWYPPHILYTYLETGLPGPKLFEQEIVIVNKDGAAAAKQMIIDIIGQENYDNANPW